MTARISIAANSSAPLFTYDFAEPGASGSVLIDNKVVMTFRDEQHLRIHAAVSQGNHQFRLVLDRPAILTFMESDDDFQYCRP